MTCGQRSNIGISIHTQPQSFLPRMRCNRGGMDSRCTASDGGIAAYYSLLTGYSDFVSRVTATSFQRCTRFDRMGRDTAARSAERANPLVAFAATAVKRFSGRSTESRRRCPAFVSILGKVLQDWFEAHWETRTRKF